MLCDFGLARVLEEIPSGLTTRSAKIGTLRYVSPELMLASSARHTRESDVWAWGCLFLEVGAMFSALLGILLTAHLRSLQTRFPTAKRASRGRLFSR